MYSFQEMSVEPIGHPLNFFLGRDFPDVAGAFFGLRSNAGSAADANAIAKKTRDERAIEHIPLMCGYQVEFVAGVLCINIGVARLPGVPRRFGLDSVSVTATAGDCSGFHHY